MSDLKIGLSLSGGGYRAAAFHLGTLRKLRELDILQEVDLISTISGGSIIGAYYCMQKEDFKSFDQTLYTTLQTKDVIKKVLLSWITLRTVLFTALFIVPAFAVLFGHFAWLSPIFVITFLILFFRFQFALFPVSKRIERIFDIFFYGSKPLGTLPDNPVLVIGTTNLNTSRLFTFSKAWMQDSTYQYLKNEKGEVEPVQFIPDHFPLSRAVIASSCVPFAFTPIIIDRKFFRNPDRDFRRVNPILIDGGVYDNQGIHKVMQTGRYACEFRIVSDAGNKIPESIFRNTFRLLIRTVDVFMARIKNVQMIQGIYTENTIEKEIAYISLGWDVDKCIPGFIDNMKKKLVPHRVIDAHNLKPEWIIKPAEFEQQITSHLKQRTSYDSIEKPNETEIKIARAVGTNLTRLKKEKVDALIKQAACITELQVKLYCPTLLKNSPGLKSFRDKV